MKDKPSTSAGVSVSPDFIAVSPPTAIVLLTARCRAALYADLGARRGAAAVPKIGLGLRPQRAPPQRIASPDLIGATP